MTVDPLTTSFTATFVVSAASGGVSANGFFLGITTGTDATGTAGGSLFNNSPAAVGIHVQNGNGTYDNSVNLLQDPQGGASGPIIQSALTAGFATTASVNDGFTVEFTINSDNTWSASSSGLSNDFTNQTGTLTAGNNRATFATFLANGFSANASRQTTAGGGGFTIDSVTVEAVVIPEPFSILLVAGGAGFFLRRRRK